VDAVIPALGLAALTGLSYLAVRHPKLYKDNLFDKIYLGGLGVFIVVGIWTIGVVTTFFFFSLFIAEDKRSIARESLPLLAGSPGWWLVGTVGFFAYLMFLVWLAGHLAREQEEQSKRG